MRTAEETMNVIESSMAMAGLPLTDEDKARILRCLEDPGIVEQTVRELIKKNKKTRR